MSISLRLIRLGDLSGPSGNTISILTTVKHQGLQQGMSEAELEVIIREALSGDYDHVLDTVSKYFNDLDGSIAALRKTRDCEYTNCHMPAQTTMIHGRWLCGYHGDEFDQICAHGVVSFHPGGANNEPGS